MKQNNRTQHSIKIKTNDSWLMKKEQGDVELPCGVGKHEWEEDSKLIETL
jgi:hypothetical protein